MQNMLQIIKENTSQNRKIPRFDVDFTRTPRLFSHARLT